MNWYLEVLKKYRAFEGKASRSEFWYAHLINFIILLAFGILDWGVAAFSEDVDVGLLGTVYSVAVFIPMLAVQIRRLHDTDRSGWWVLIGLVPVIGWITLVIFSAQKGTEGENQYDDNQQDVLAESS